MQKQFLIGNLGSDAELRKDGGQPFVTMSISSTRRVKNPDGSKREIVDWVSCTLNGENRELLPYLKRGVKVAVYGDVTTRLFHSEKERGLKAGLNMFIRDLELVNTNIDAVPRTLYKADGAAVNVMKFFFAENFNSGELYDRHGLVYKVDKSGVIIPQVKEVANNESNPEKSNG